MNSTIGKIHSIQSLGASDGPGVRFVAFLSGCPLRCHCCHNPDTWDFGVGTPYTPEQLVDKAKNFKEYYGQKGGVTLSGGEPLCQADFVKEFFRLCKEIDLNTCLDTSGAVLNDKVKSALKYTDRVLLDIKYTDDALYKKHVGMGLDVAISFLAYLNEMGIPTTVRQVIIPSVNDTEENAVALAEIVHRYPCVDGVELLPFRKICQTKYDSLDIPFPFGNLPEASPLAVSKLQGIISEKLKS